eukprot:363466-Chlamydomonas_euryale.AAC.7
MPEHEPKLLCAPRQRAVWPVHCWPATSPATVGLPRHPQLLACHVTRNCWPATSPATSTLYKRYAVKWGAARLYTVGLLCEPKH